jgi:hypothetical protein
VVRFLLFTFVIGGILANGVWPVHYAMNAGTAFSLPRKWRSFKRVIVNLTVLLRGSDRNCYSAFVALISDAARSNVYTQFNSSPSCVMLQTESEISLFIYKPNTDRYSRLCHSPRRLALRNGIGNEPVSTLIDGVKRFDITARFDDNARASVGALRDIPLRTANGAPSE